jgi:hypothetical protein
MAPPPSQKGVFKPRKPKRIVQPGETSATVDGASGGTGTTSSSSATVVAFDPSTSGGGRGGGRGDGPANRYGNRNNNSSNDGRGGRGGRGGGRGRSPAPQGRVFFTGGERKPATKSSTSGSASKRKSTEKGIEPGKSGQRGNPSESSSNSRDVADSTEEVVGQLETAIGGHHGKNKNDGKGKTGGILGGSNDKMDYYDDEADGATGTRNTMDIGVPGCMYDSDSSDDGSLTRKDPRTGFMAPMELPFPTTTNPEDTASSRQPARVGKDRIRNSNTSPSWTSPFGSVHEGKVTFEETNSWFLVQLPTRLPPLKQRNPPPANSTSMGHDDDDGMDGMVADSAPSNDAVVHSDFSEVITPPVMTSDFDNSLEGVAPGQIGRILVYKSGKTVLVMDGPDGRKVRLWWDINSTWGIIQIAVVLIPN